MTTDQDIRFCTAWDGVRIAYATSGAGPPLVKAANWLNHLEYDWESPVWRHMFRELSRDHRLIRYDERGNGMSDWDVEDLSFDAWVHDLEAVVDAAGLDRFALFGLSQGAAVSVVYTARHPERVSHLIVHGGWARGWGRRSPEELEIREALTTLVRAGWGQENPAFRQVFTSRFVPEGTIEHQHWFNELQRRTTSPANAVRLAQSSRDVDVTDLLPRIQAPTLVLHARGDAVAPFELGREIATLVPGARFVPLESRNHLLLDDEPAFQVFLRETRRFLGVESTAEVVASNRHKSGERGAARLGPGSQLGQYVIEAPLGEGGMGIVYRARDTKLRRDVALKVLAGDTATGTEMRRRLLREARHAAALSHPNICVVFDVAEAGGVDFIVMELVPGPSLRAMTSEGALPPEQVESLGRQVADALAHAHAQGVVHGDLKSANVVVRADGRAQVLDFGIARRLNHGDAGGTTGDQVTGNQIAGTPAYMAPEVLSGGVPDAHSDVWALGVLLFEMVTGTLPFRGEGLGIAAAVLRDEPILPGRGITSELGNVIRQCLDKRPGHRPSAAEVSRRLQGSGFDPGFPVLGGMFDR